MRRINVSRNNGCRLNDLTNDLHIIDAGYEISYSYYIRVRSLFAVIYGTIAMLTLMYGFYAGSVIEGMAGSVVSLAAMLGVYAIGTAVLYLVYRVKWDILNGKFIRFEDGVVRFDNGIVIEDITDVF